ncbi:hypothetical protein PUR49_32545 [Streptomyces sp. BE147]|uniref:hypothetical protein n=1 Tax=Streptomyces sp. BE147 TaxID=3002524 RepID=UPI002E79FC23|nr:hypothetical protein [Streptomyces sp. BE147]MEE1741202.1 hypothetical protein [Streptomyces sp. BE147]
MTDNLRHKAREAAGLLIEASVTAAGLVGGAVGAYAGYHHIAPDTWSDTTSVLAAAVFAIGGYVGSDSLAEMCLDPLRRRLHQARNTIVPYRATHPAPLNPAATANEALTQVAAATRTDAAHRAADAAYNLDHSDNFLRSTGRWHGYEDGTAMFFLAPGLVLHRRSQLDKYGTTSEFTLWSGDSDTPVVITSLEQIHRQLSARIAGLPVTASEGGSASGRFTTA